VRNLQTEARFDSATGEGVTSAYDGFGRMVSSSIDLGGVTRTLAYRYDRNGTRTRISHPDGAVFEQSRDGAGRPVLLSGPAAGPLLFVNYTAHGAPGNAGRGNQDASYFTYDGLQRLVAASPNVTLSYDPLGRPHQVTGASGTTTFLYAGDALVAEYDDGGNLRNKTAGGAS